MATVTDITGIGPAKAETLDEHGYASLEDIAEADQDELADVDGVGDDRALEFIIGANDLLEDEDSSEDESSESEDEFDLTPSEVSEEIDEAKEELDDDVLDDGSPYSEQEEEEAEAVSEDEQSESEDDDEPYTISISFDNRRQYDTFHAALMRRHEDVFSGNQPAADALEECLDQLDGQESVTYELDEYEVNTLHTAVKQARTDYQGRNLIEHMDALKEVEQVVDEQRRELLF